MNLLWFITTINPTKMSLSKPKFCLKNMTDFVRVAKNEPIARGSKIFYQIPYNSQSVVEERDEY